MNIHESAEDYLERVLMIRQRIKEVTLQKRTERRPGLERFHSPHLGLTEALCLLKEFSEG